MTLLHRAERSEDGQVLLLALAFVLAVGLIVTALLFEASGGFAATRTLGGVLQTQYQADAAVQEANNALTVSGNALPLIPPAPFIPLWVPCPTAPGDSNPVFATSTTQIYSYCTILSDTFQQQNVEVTACADKLFRTVTDGVSTTTNTVTSATANFSPADVGKDVETTDPIHNTNVFSTGAGTYITSVTNSTTAVLSQATTAGGTGLDWTITSGDPGACTHPLLREYVTLSKSTPISTYTVTVVDWSELYGKSA